ncbi:unnamed protein product [Malus baccata var. baccata]
MRRLYWLPFVIKFHQLLCTIGCPSWPIYSPRALEPFVPTANHEVIGPMIHAPTNNIATPVATQENVVHVLTANYEDPDFWRYLEANFYAEPGTNQQFESPAKATAAWGKWNDFSHGSNMPVYPPQSPNPLINIYCPRYDEAVKNVILKDEHFPSDLPGFGDDSYRFDPIEICNVVHFLTGVIFNRHATHSIGTRENIFKQGA